MKEEKKEKKKEKTSSGWLSSRKGQKVLVMIAFMTIPLLLLFVFTYLPSVSYTHLTLPTKLEV